MNSKTVSYATLAAALALTGTVVAGKIIGNGNKDDPACNDQMAGTTYCDNVATAKLVQPPSQHGQSTTVQPASAVQTSTKPN